MLASISQTKPWWFVLRSKHDSKWFILRWNAFIIELHSVSIKMLNNRKCDDRSKDYEKENSKPRRDAFYKTQTKSFVPEIAWTIQYWQFHHINPLVRNCNSKSFRISNIALKLRSANSSFQSFSIWFPFVKCVPLFNALKRFTNALPHQIYHKIPPERAHS